MHAFFARHLHSRVRQVIAGFYSARGFTSLQHSACIPIPTSLFMYTRFHQYATFCVYSKPCQFSHIHAVLQGCLIPRVCQLPLACSNTRGSAKLLYFACMPVSANLFMYTQFYKIAALRVYASFKQAENVHAHFVR